MSLLAPLFLVGGLAAAVPLLLHLLKRHPESIVKFSAVHLLKQAPIEHASRRHLRELLLLALRIAAIVAAAFAFARPYLTASAAEGGRALVVALDTSFSMSGPGRFERARAAALDAIDHADRSAAIAIVVFSDTAQVVSALSTDRALARTAIGAVQPTPRGTRYRAALATAAELLRNRSGRLIVVTDRQGTGWAPDDRAQWPQTLDLEVVDIGALGANLSVTSAAANADHVVATIRNGSAHDVSVPVHLEVGMTPDGRSAQTAGELTVPVGAGQSAPVVFPRPHGRWAAVRVDNREGPDADNARYLLLEGNSRPTVLLLTATGDADHEAFYAEQALTASAPGDAATYDVEGVAGAALQTWDQARLDRYAAVLLISTRGLDHRGRQLLTQYLQNGGGLFVAASADVDSDILGELLGSAHLSFVPAEASKRDAPAWRLAPGDFRHPVLQAFAGQSSLGLAVFRQPSALHSDDCPVLARFTNGQPALVECVTGKGRALVFASDLDNRGNDFPLHATFLPFVHQAVRYVAGQRRALDFLVSSVPPGIAPVPGIAPLAAGDANSPLASVNVDPSESEPAHMTAQEFDQAIVRVPTTTTASPRLLATERESQQHLWQYVLAMMLALLLVEGVVSMRAA